MKKTILTLGVALVATGAFAQGKVSLVNDATRLFVYGQANTLKPGDAALSGTGLPQTSAFKYALWGAAGTGTTDPAALVKVSNDFMFSTAALPLGRLGGNAVTLPSNPAFPSATFATFQIRTWEATFSSYADAVTGLGYVGASPVFTVKPGAAVPNPLNSTLASAGSTWAPGLVAVGIIPEPASAAIIGLGLASLLIFRRRK